VHGDLPLIGVVARELANSNRMLVMAITASLTGQVLKFVIGSIRARRLAFQRLTESGGMPSSHSATVTSLATAVGITHGWRSDLFAVVAVFALIVLYDAVGIRQAVGQQSRFLNHILGREKLELKPFKEALGHTPLEVAAGAALGIVITLVFY
jgi:acid phosphatase family membrane protein YuiD